MGDIVGNVERESRICREEAEHDTAIALAHYDD